MIGSLPSLRSSRNPLVFLGLMGVVIYAGYQAAQLVLAGDISGLMFVALVSAGGTVVVTMLNDWRRGLYVLVAWILFEDFARKFLGNNMAVYFGKDILALILYVSFFRARISQKMERFRFPFRIVLLTYIWYAFLQVFNPSSNSVFYGILGMKVDFLYVPLIFVGYALLESEEDLRRFLYFTCLLIIVVGGLGLAQSIIGPTFLSPAHLQEDIRELGTTYRVAPLSGVIAYRPTSVFVSAGRFQDFLILAWLISLGNAGYLLLRSRKGRTMAFLTLGVVAATSLMCASRGVFMWNGGIALIVTAGFLWGAPWRQGQALRVMRTIQRTTLFAGSAIIVLMTIFPDEVASRMAIYSETLMPNSAASELVSRTKTYPLQQLEYAFEHPLWPYGYGLGTCTLGIQYVIRILGVRPMYIGVESGYGNLVVELGIVGLVLWLVLGISITFSEWKIVKTLKGTPWFPLSFVIFLFAVLLFFPMGFYSLVFYQDFVINVYFWLFLGILFRLPKFARAATEFHVQETARQA